MSIWCGQDAGRGGLLVGLVVLCFPSSACAHLVSTGMGPVYDGIGHLLLTPEDVVPVLVLALYAGLRGAIAGKKTMFLLPLAWFAGGAAGQMFQAAPLLPLPIISFLVLGGLVAADLNLPVVAVAVLAVLFGLAHGYLSGAALKGAGFPGLAGTTIILFILVAPIAAFVVSLEKPWTRIAARVAGSWVFASGLLMLGWLVRGAI